MSSDEQKLRIPSAKKMEKIREVLTEDEDFRFGRIKLDGKKPRFELPAPTQDDPDNVETAKSFFGVVLVAKKNFYQSDEDKEAGNDPKEKRALYVLRAGRFTPELLYVSPTAIRNWKFFAKEVVTGNKQYSEVLCEFTAEQVKGKQYTWSKPKFAVARTLTEEELAHVQDMRELVAARIEEYEGNADLDKYEDQALSVDKTKDRVVTEEDIPKITNASVESDDEDKDETPAAPAKRKATRKAEKTTSDDDENENKPKSEGRAGYPNLDDDDED